MKLRMWLPALAVVACALILVGCPAEEPPAEEAAPETEAMEPKEETADEPKTAFAEIQGREGTEVKGVVTFTQTDEGVKIVARLMGVEGAGPHGFHLHTEGNCSAPDFTSTGGHFNPTGVDHGAPDADVHHAGDFGNLDVNDDGTGHLDMVSTMLTFEGESSLVGRGVILHEKADDLTSQPTGAAGARIGCGVIKTGGIEIGEEEMGEEGEMEGDAADE